MIDDQDLQQRAREEAVKTEQEFFIEKPRVRNIVIQCTASGFIAGYRACELELTSLQAVAEGMAEVLQQTRNYLNAQGTNGNHWIPLVDKALAAFKDWKEKPLG